MPRFVILEPDHPQLHRDLMLETGDVLRTWRLMRPPEIPGETIEAVAIGDHRKAYLDYEGPVSGNRGSVRRWDAGEHEADESTGSFRLVFHGQRLRGAARLGRLQAGAWQFEWSGY